MQANGDPPLVATLVFPVQGNRIMLATKMRGVGVGYLNGWGGGVEPGESIHECAMREFKEETGGAEITPDILKADAFHCRGVVHFRNYKEDGRVVFCDVVVYTTSFWFGEIHSTEEMRSPAWHKVSNIPHLGLMPGDKFWLPKFIHGRNMHAWVVYGPEQRELLDDVVVVSSLDE